MKIIVYILGLVCVAGLIMIFWNTIGPGAERKRMEKRIERIRQRRIGVRPAQDMSLRRKGDENKGLVYWLMKPLPDFKRLGDQLERAGKTITAKRYVFRRALVTLGIILVLAGVFKMKLIIAASIAVIVGIWLPLKLLKRRINKQGKAFLRLFPDAIDLIVRGLRSGLPVSESLVLVSHEVPDPVGSVFMNIANTMKLGVTMEKVLQETAHKLDLTEFNFFVTSIILQRETGGNLSEILNNLSEVLRSRYIMHMKIRAMSSEARASAIIIGALPFVVIGAVMAVSPGYMTPLWTDYRGNICAAVAAAMMGFGLWTMNKMTKFEI